MVQIVIKKSSNKNKKFEARIDNRKTVLFGAKGYDHFTVWMTNIDKVLWQDMEAVIKTGKIMKRLGSGRTIFFGGSPLIKKR